MAFEDQVAADHDAGAAFTCLAVNGDDIVLILQIIINVNAKLPDHIEWRRVVIVEREILANRVLLEVTLVVLALRAQIVYLVTISMIIFEEVFHVYY